MTTCGNTASTSSVASAEPLLPTLSVPLTLTVYSVFASCRTSETGT
ncbi:Uncharacterised protein [Enterobacter ludwigii]|nr:Uncharacterised protein [Enterobacter ludwigii]